MKKTKLVIIAAAILLVLAAIAAPAVAQEEGRKAPMARCIGRPGGRGFGPQFTLEQQEQIEKIHERYNDERVELANRLKVMRLEMREIIQSDKPDFDAIEKKMEDVAAVRLDMAKLRLKIHKDIRPLLNDDQRVLFDRGFGRHLGRRGLGCMGDGPMRGRGGMGRCGKMVERGHRMGGGPSGGMGMCGGMGMAGGMGSGMGPRAATGTCPWVSDVEVEVEELE